MTAVGTLQQVSTPTNSANSEPLRPRLGVITLRCYQSSARVDRGHLVLREFVAGMRREVRLPRVGHGLRRLVVIGSDGFVSLAALRWLADQDAAFLMLERDGSVLLATGPASPKDARLRRAQALAHHNGIALTIARELVGRKLTQQARNACDYFGNQSIAG